jgi:hypothetical protein
MTKLIAVALALALVSVAEAIPRAPLQTPADTFIPVREACGAGMHRVNGVCVTTHARRAARRCAAGVTCAR